MSDQPDPPQPPPEPPVKPTPVRPIPPPLRVVRHGFSLPWPFNRRTSDDDEAGDPQWLLPSRPPQANADGSRPAPVRPIPPSVREIPDGYTFRWPFKRREAK